MNNYKKTLVTTLVILMITAIIVPVIKADTQTNDPSAYTRQNNQWQDPTGAYSDSGTSDPTPYAFTDSQKWCEYYGYGFTVPAGSTINGITVRLDAWQSIMSNAYFTVQLSWDDGVTWTSAKNVPGPETTNYLTTTQTTYNAGGSSDTWGRLGASAWTPDQINNHFRVNVTSAKTSGSTGTWYLDYIPVEITYATTPPDNIAPTTMMSPSPLAAWYKDDVSVTLIAMDNEGGSGVKEIHYTLNGVSTTVAGSSVTFTVGAEGYNALSYYAVDNNGNTEESHTSATINIDKTAPEISGSATTDPNENGWYKTDVTVHFIAADSLSGVASVTADQTLTGEGKDQSVEGTAVDNAGNSASYTVLGINIDKTAPIVDHNAVPATVFLNQPLSIDWSATDGLSGIDGSNHGTITGVTSSIGQHSITIPAVTDLAGNIQASVVINYNVIYSTSYGHKILQPLEQVNSPSELTKSYKFGSTLPIKFQLCDYYGNPVGPAETLPTLQVNFIGTIADQTDPIVNIDASGASNTGNVFRYDSVAQQYVFNLSTKGMALGTYKITVTLNDASTIVTFFQLKK